MCDLFGLSCNEEDRATKSLPKFANQFGTYDKNCDGWGVAYFDNNVAFVEKASERNTQKGESSFAAAENKKFFDAVDEARSTNIIAHVRTASGATDVCELNCHPFKYRYHERDWIFAHNGYVMNRNFERDPGAEGSTDSETIFHKMMRYVDGHMSGGSIRGLYPAMKKAVRQILDDYPGVKLNFLMSDGNMHYAFSHYSDKPMYIQRNMKGYGNAVLLSTRIFGGGNWEEIPVDRLLVLNCGEVIVCSSKI